MQNPADTPAAVYTIGHSNHAPEVFLELLRAHGIGLVVDVRSSPYSGYAKHFNKDSIQGYLEAAGIRYLFLGDVIGGRPQGDEFYDAEGYVLYGRVAGSGRFQEGLARLLDEAAARRIALMCGEEDPKGCHRRLLVGRVLGERGVSVLHVRGDGRLQSEEELAAEERFRKTKGQLSLFDVEEPDEWKSTRSVLPNEAPPSSSRRSGGRESGG
jgi:uncharacterized protein (DUF488 family)